MTRAARISNIGAVIVPPAAFLLAIVLFWNQIVGWTDLAILAVMWFVTAAGITIGYHRMLTHRAFQTSKPVEYAFAVLGTMAVQGPVIHWVADHRKHHAFTDHEGDPHSPHVGHGDGVMGMLRGLYHSHIGWLWVENGQANRRKFAPDLMEDRGMRWISRHFVAIIGIGLLIPALAGFALSGFTLKGALTALLWGGFVRVFAVHHITWSINSVCHFFGTRRFETDDESRNVFWLALPSLGEAWHHNHHAFPRSARQGLRWYELDPSWGIIWTLEKLGLVWNVVRISPERQHSRLHPVT
jgi:stearoyl-CoA desaturase (delta-9 desaturase)